MAYSHGIMRVPYYAQRFQDGGASATAQPEIIRRKASAVLMDGKNGLGMMACKKGMDLAMEIAAETGTAAISILGSNHFGTCAYWAEMAAANNMIGICWTIGAANNMAPWGGTDRRLGNNPFAIAAPCLTKPTVVLDMATSVVARGKIMFARKTHSPIPDTWALDRNGKPTTDAEEGYLGTVRPVGDYKGYGLTLICAILSAILPGAAFGDNVTDIWEDTDKCQDVGHLLQVIDIAAFSDVTAFKKRMDDAVDYLKASPLAEGVKQIYMPGEIEAANLERQRRDGITYTAESIEELRKLSKARGLEAMA